MRRLNAYAHAHAHAHARTPPAHTHARTQADAEKSLERLHEAAEIELKKIVDQAASAPNFLVRYYKHT